MYLQAGERSSEHQRPHCLHLPSFVIEYSTLSGERPTQIKAFEREVDKRRSKMVNYIFFLRVTPFLPNTCGSSSLRPSWLRGGWVGRWREAAAETHVVLGRVQVYQRSVARRSRAVFRLRGGLPPRPAAQQRDGHPGTSPYPLTAPMTCDAPVCSKRSCSDSNRIPR